MQKEYQKRYPGKIDEHLGRVKEDAYDGLPGHFFM